ncbi:MAG: patatin-like phospholipase family protein, partial [Telluria sp.]
MHDVAVPRLALVLGSGGVRSVAALGLVEVQRREGIVPDLLVGCSAGAMVGALVTFDYPEPEALRIATTLWTAEIARQRRWVAVPQMLWPRQGCFDADFAMRHDHLIRTRLAQA